jgi:hypothetical protein
LTRFCDETSKRRPTANEMVEIPNHHNTDFSRECKTLLLKVGNHDIIPCSIITK